jgi:hypothetical protein
LRALIVEDGFQRGSLAAARALSKAGWQVGIGSPQEGFASSSRFAAAWHRVPSPEDGGDGFLEAVRKAVEAGGYDDIVLSTLPAGASRWLKLDLPSRVQRVVPIPVVVVESAAS